ncbi:MAG TPA: ABC transporter ATP-binding protein [Candidatus Limnocylindrales bacterium]|nr:ABC transporter ATP-binding protein [Candidatus Limnocylindrales bacterium]
MTLVKGTARQLVEGPALYDDGALIRTRGLTKSYRQGELEVPALRGVDLDVADGEFTALAGPSGSGKTTLLNLIGALDKPTGGTIEVAGRDIRGLGKGEAADFRLAHVGFVFQAYNLVPVLTAYENAEVTLLLRGEESERRRGVVRPLLERVGLGDMMDRKPHELSGGQQQRVAIVRALATDPRLVLADEPTANLDSGTSEGLLDLMAELNAELGTTFLFSTHDPVVIDRARRVVDLHDGRVHRTRIDP